jgi:hypothetical protein
MTLIPSKQDNLALESSNEGFEVVLVVASYYIAPKSLEPLIEKFIVLAGLKSFIVERQYFNLNAEKFNTSDNSDWISINTPYFDFSAYQKFKFNKSKKNRLYLFINDTLFVKHPFRYIAFYLYKNLRLFTSINVPSSLGIVYPYDEFISNAQTGPIIYHITTYCFILNYEAANHFKKDLLSLPLDEDQKSQIELIENCKIKNSGLKYMIDILFGEAKTRLSYKKRNLISDEKYIGKAISVIMEYKLSERIYKNNGLIIPINRNFFYKIEKIFRSILARVKFRDYF